MNNIYLFSVHVGVLILSLDKDTYEQLGLTGKSSAFQKKHRFSKYNITVRTFMLVIVITKLKLFCVWRLSDHIYILFNFSYCVHSSIFLGLNLCCKWWMCYLCLRWISPLFVRIISVDSKGLSTIYSVR